jgi:hypothetical protein
MASVTEVTLIREEAIDPSAFELPTDYETTSLMEAVPAGSETGNQEAAPEGRRVPRLRDLLNR